jgi:hypothetical protein
MNFLQLAFIFCLALKAQAFPDLIRYGYTSCATCHMSPSGGGLLNGYGRSLSEDEMSTWSYKGESQPLHGLIKMSDEEVERFLLGGDLRSLNKVAQNSQGKTDEGFLMQAQLRFGFLYKKFKAAVAIGKIEDPRNSKVVRAVSPEYYLMWSPDDKLSMRIGRFEPIYGLRLPDHNLWVKSEASLVPWAEKDALEWIYEDQDALLSLAGFQGLSSNSPSYQSTGFTGSYYRIVNEKHRLGISGTNSEGQGLRVKNMSAHATLSISKETYMMAEFAKVSVLESKKDIYFVRIAHELFKGFSPFLQYQSKEDFTLKQKATKSGLGVTWLPRPHFEIFGLAEKVIDTRGESNEGLLVLHYYL